MLGRERGGEVGVRRGGRCERPAHVSPGRVGIDQGDHGDVVGEGRQRRQVVALGDQAAAGDEHPQGGGGGHGQRLRASSEWTRSQCSSDASRW